MKMDVASSYFLSIVALVALKVVICQEKRLLCFECKNAGSNAHCMKIGGITRCQPNENSCMTEIRRARAGWNVFRITKRCKQALACDNNYWQNVGGVKNKPQKTGRQCAGRQGLPHASTTCRCCCSENLCNSGLYDACFGTPPRVRDEELNEPRCPPLEELPMKGNKKCSNSNKPGSHCTFTCKDEYDMFGEKQISCQKTDGVIAKWTGNTPCCAKPCPPYGNVDLVFAIQSNVPRNRDWEKMKLYLLSIMRNFLQARDADTRVGFFTFSDKPDKAEEVFLNDRMSRMKELNRQIYGLKQTEFSGTMREQLGHVDLERALVHAQRNSLTPYKGDRKKVRDVMVLMTYGDCPSEQPYVSIPARQLRDDGVKILVVNVQPKGQRISKRYMNDLMQISGSRSKLLLLRNGLEGSMNQLSGPLQRAICGDPCERYVPLRSEDHGKRS